MKFSTLTNIKKFTILSLVLLVILSSTAIYNSLHKTKNLFPLLLEIKNHPEPLRTPDTFREDFSDSASIGKLIFNSDQSITFQYTKSTQQKSPFTGFFFPLENIALDFSKYSSIEIEIATKKARRIPLNLSVQNKKETHQYIRSFIEVKKGQSKYNLPLADFFTPTSWYSRNKISQVEIPAQDLSKVEALSIESCHLLAPGIPDDFTIKGMALKKDLTWTYVTLITLLLLGELSLWLLLFKPYQKEVEVVHIPFTPQVEEPSEKLEDKILQYLSTNYTNPNLSLNDLSAEFGKSGPEISKIIKAQTKLTFPKHLSYLRIEEAKRILKSENVKTIAEVGYQVGFNSPSNFIRVFKSCEGTSPKKFAQ